MSFEAMVCAERNELPRSAQNRGSRPISRAERNPLCSTMDQDAIGYTANESHQEAVKKIRHPEALFLKTGNAMHIRRGPRAIHTRSHDRRRWTRHSAARIVRRAELQPMCRAHVGARHPALRDH